MFRGLQHYMKGCSKLERLDFAEQTVCNSAYLKVTMSAEAETVLLCYKGLDTTREFPSHYTCGGFPFLLCCPVCQCPYLWVCPVE